MAKNPAGAPGGVLYEPRSLWSVMTVDTTPFENFSSETGPLGEIPQIFPREQLRNGFRYPITITRVALMGVNYLYAQTPDTMLTPIDAGNGMINRVRVRLGVPFRQHYSRFEISAPTYCPRPSWGEPTIATARANLFGLSRLNYDCPLYIPRTGAIEMQLSSPADLTLVNPNTPNIFGAAGVTSVPAEMCFLEEGGLLPGSARSRRIALNLAQDPGQRPGQNGWPYSIPPNFGPATVDNGVRFWDRRHSFSAKEWRTQEATRAGSTKQLGVSVALDQTAYDQALLDLFGATGKIAPLSARVGSRIRTVDFGSQSDWWRPGAPLALTFDSLTPATVYELPQPITLQPGDTFEAEALVPGPQYSEAFGGDFESPTNNASHYVVGISFNGYATVSS